MRLIDADKLQKQFNEKSTNPNYRVNMHNIKAIISNAPTIEVIPKADYEARLKADMVAMLEDLDLRLAEQYNENKYVLHNDSYNVGIEQAQSLIQERINALKENKNGTN